MYHLAISTVTAKAYISMYFILYSLFSVALVVFPVLWFLSKTRTDRPHAYFKVKLIYFFLILFNLMIAKHLR